jgi:hypothetical protein
MLRPLKRHPALVPLSRDHHHGLLLVWKIRQGLQREAGPERISRYLLYFFRDFLCEHFREEEAHLFVLLEANDAMRVRAEQDHREIFSLVTAIENGKDATSLLSRFADLLGRHIRFEERELFNHIETVAGPQLAAAANDKAHGAAPVKTELWEDEFWKSPQVAPQRLQF